MLSFTTDDDILLPALKPSMKMLFLFFASVVGGLQYQSSLLVLDLCRRGGVGGECENQYKFNFLLKQKAYQFGVVIERGANNESGSIFGSKHVGELVGWKFPFDVFSCASRAKDFLPRKQQKTFFSACLPSLAEGNKKRTFCSPASGCFSYREVDAFFFLFGFSLCGTNEDAAEILKYDH